jgi:hypothetical protein
MSTDPRDTNVSCARCGRPAPIDPDYSVTGGGQGDPDLPSIDVPDGWIGDPESDGVLCGNCGKPEEITTFMQGKEHVEELDPSSLEGEPTDPAQRAMLGLPPLPADPEDAA